jgi:hypothetical protein
MPPTFGLSWDCRRGSGSIENHRMKTNLFGPRRVSPAGSLFCVLLGLLLGVRADGLVVSEEAVAGGDEIPPAPASQLRAIDRPEDVGGHVLISWALSPDDRIVFRSMPNGGNVPGVGSIFPARGIRGYRLYRYQEGGTPERIAEVAAGVDQYVDAGVEDNILYFYEVCAFDSAHETAPLIEPGGEADRARSARAIDNAQTPVGADGSPVLGWFDPADDTVDFNDFFLFADYFGFAEGESGFDPLFDLDGDHRVDFADFFLFADYFGRKVANYDAIIGSAG